MWLLEHATDRKQGNQKPAKLYVGIYCSRKTTPGLEEPMTLLFLKSPQTQSHDQEGSQL